MKSFRLGDIWVLICTELMGRGIDFKGVNLVVNYDFPNSAVSYIHRIGNLAICIYTNKVIHLKMLPTIIYNEYYLQMVSTSTIVRWTCPECVQCL